jgi:hypothetical protein
LPTMLDFPFFFFFFCPASHRSNPHYGRRTSVCDRFSFPSNKYKWSGQRKNIGYVLTKLESFGRRQMSSL